MKLFASRRLHFYLSGIMDKLIAGVGEPTVIGGRSGFLPALNVMEDVAHYALLLRELASLLTTAFSEFAGDVR